MMTGMGNLNSKIFDKKMDKNNSVTINKSYGQIAGQIRG
jgi:hypothetical protein